MPIFQDPEFWRLLSEALEEERQAKVEAFELGRVSKENYDREVGFLTGLRRVDAIAKEIVKKMNGEK